MITADDKLIWGTPSGTVLTCKKSVMVDDQEIAFTEGKQYVVDSMHPIAEPAYVRLTDDQGDSHKMAGEHIREFFSR